jgi:hypothetical protein
MLVWSYAPGRPPAQIGAALVGAAFRQAIDSPEGYGQGGERYAKRFGSGMARDASDNLFGTFLIASVLHEDPRFYVKKDLSFSAAVEYSAVRVAITRSVIETRLPAAHLIRNVHYSKGDIHHLHRNRSSRTSQSFALTNFSACNQQTCARCRTAKGENGYRRRSSRLLAAPESRFLLDESGLMECTNRWPLVRVAGVAVGGAVGAFSRVRNGPTLEPVDANHVAGT